MINQLSICSSAIISHSFSSFTSPSFGGDYSGGSISIPSELCLEEDSGLTLGEMKRILMTSSNIFQLALLVRYSCPSASISIISACFGLAFDRISRLALRYSVSSSSSMASSSSMLCDRLMRVGMGRKKELPIFWGVVGCLGGLREGQETEELLWELDLL